LRCRKHNIPGWHTVEGALKRDCDNSERAVVEGFGVETC
jgi:hypothetical protein